MSIWLRDSCIGICFAVFIAAQAMSFGAVPAAAEPGGLSTEQGGAGQSQSDSEQESAGYNGGDITRPQNQLDVRFQYRTSWQPDTRTQQGRMLLRSLRKSSLMLDGGLGFLPKCLLWTKKRQRLSRRIPETRRRPRINLALAMHRSRLIWPRTSTKTGHLGSARAELGLQRKIRWEAESGKSCQA